jgi:hypothetical protein
MGRPRVMHFKKAFLLFFGQSDIIVFFIYFDDLFRFIHVDFYIWVAPTASKFSFYLKFLYYLCNFNNNLQNCITLGPSTSSRCDVRCCHRQEKQPVAGEVDEVSV